MPGVPVAFDLWARALNCGHARESKDNQQGPPRFARRLYVHTCGRGRTVMMMMIKAPYDVRWSKIAATREEEDGETT